MVIIWVLNIANENRYQKDGNGNFIIGEDGNPLCSFSSGGGSSTATAPNKITTNNETNNNSGTNTSSGTNNGTNNGTNSGTNNNSSNKTNNNQANNATISLDKSILMLDNWHYNVGEITATISPKNAYKAKEIKWSVKDTDGSKVVRFVNSFSDSAKKTVSTTGTTVKVRGIHFGTAIITATLPNGKSAKVKMKVIASANEKVSGDQYVGGKYQIYIRKKSKSWGNEYVESYVNNVAELTKKYATNSKFKHEAAAKKFTVYRQANLKIHYNSATKKITGTSGGTQSFPKVLGGSEGRRVLNSSAFKRYTVKKGYGKIDTNGYVFVFTSKNQWGYILKKNSSGRFKLVDSKMLSAGMVINKYEMYYIAMYASQYLLTMEAVNYTNNVPFKSSTSTAHGEVKGLMIIKRGYPSSNGCTHMGTYADSTIYYQLFVKAGLGTRVMHV